MNYQTEIDKYQRMYQATPETKWVTRRLIANKLDRLLQERSNGRERFFDCFEPPAFKIPIIEGFGKGKEDGLCKATYPLAFEKGKKEIKENKQ